MAGGAWLLGLTVLPDGPLKPALLRESELKLHCWKSGETNSSDEIFLPVLGVEVGIWLRNPFTEI